MIRIAMWCGPRNISTALMRAWENRTDTIVVDEPFYAHYLASTGLQHPGYDEILASQPTAWRQVADALSGPINSDATIFYQKHMCHHLPPNPDHEWMDSMRHAFLIRDPARMINSYVAARERLDDIADLGLDKQLALFKEVKAKTGKTPPVIDSKDVLMNPQGMMKALCAALDVPYDEAMLSWPAGARESDGVWAPHWYGSVEKSTGFAPYKDSSADVAPEYRDILNECMPLYDALYSQRLTPLTV